MSQHRRSGGAFPIGNNGDSPPSKKIRQIDEETPMEVDDDDRQQSQQQNTPVSSSPSGQASSSATGSTSADNAAKTTTSSVGTDTSGQQAPDRSPAPAGSAVTAGTSSTVSGQPDVKPKQQSTERSSGTKRKHQKPVTHEYQTYSDSIIGQQVPFKPLPTKPSDLMPSDQNVQEGGKQQTSQAQNPDQVVANPDPNVAAAQPPPAAQGQGQIVIKYPDGREEIIDVVNVQSVRQVAKAGQVIPAPTGSLSASFPQTSQLHQLSTSSLPAPLRPGVDDTQESSAQSTAQPVPSTSHTVSTSKQSADDSEVKGKKKSKKPAVKYQSHSAPTIAEPRTKTTEPEPSQMYSIDISSLSKKFKKKCITSLQLLEMQADLERMSDTLRSIEEEEKLSDKEKKGVQILRKLIADLIQNRQNEERTNTNCHRCTIS